MTRTEANVKETLLILALLLSVGWLVMMIRRGKAEVREAAKAKTPNKTTAFHAVSVKYPISACNAAKVITGRRFLSSAAPQLPLPECDALECQCGFKHHADRRSGRERRSPYNSGIYASGTATMKTERRIRKDRRRHAEITNF